MTITFGPRRAVPLDQSAVALISEQAALNPDRPALVFPGKTTSYAELEARAKWVAARLTSLGIAKGSLVAVLGTPSEQLVVTLVGIWYAGAAYLALDMSNPWPHNRGILASAGYPPLFTETHIPEEYEGSHHTLAMLHDGSGRFTSAPRHSGVDGDDLAYVAPTSGSTGRPKLVRIPHRAILRLVVNTDYLSIRPTDVIAFGSNLAFDAATFELWATLLNGACLHYVPRSLLLSSYELRSHLEASRISILFLTTALFHLHASIQPGMFRGLRAVLVGGEAMQSEAARRVTAAGGPNTLLNMYGPTEATTFSTWMPALGIQERCQIVPIGRPIANTSVYALNESLEPVQAGEVGELYIGGIGVADGYLDAPELTAERFVDDPWSSDHRTMYRTGDLVRWSTHHGYEFIGRRDHQVKIRGFRIELPGVEAVLAGIPGVKSVAVGVRGTGNARQLVADVVAPTLTVREIIEWARVNIPEYMVPRVRLVDSVPLTPNGKVDRSKIGLTES